VLRKGQSKNCSKSERKPRSWIEEAPFLAGLSKVEARTSRGSSRLTQALKPRRVFQAFGYEQSRARAENAKSAE